MSEHPRPSKTLLGKRIELRARDPEQAAEMFALIDANRGHFRPWFPWEKETKSVEDSKSYLEMAASWWQDCKTYDFSMFEIASGKMIGSFGLHSLNWKSRQCELGYWVDKAHEGKGYVNEAVELGEKLAQELGFHRVVITCNRTNKRSQTVATRRGYTLEGKLIDERGHGVRQDTLQFVKLMNPAIEGEYTENLPEGVSIKNCTAEEFWKATEKLLPQVFDEKELIVRVRELLSEKEKAEVKALWANYKHPYEDYALMKYNGDVIGWTWGFQDSGESYYMVNSAILPEHRGRGLYNRLLEVTLEKLKAKGYQRIWSRHNMTNNAVIVPKLKHGFIITGTELSDMFGSLIHLTYFTNKTRRKVVDFRAGSLRPDEELKNILKL